MHLPQLLITLQAAPDRIDDIVIDCHPTLH